MSSSTMRSDDLHSLSVLESPLTSAFQTAFNATIQQGSGTINLEGYASPGSLAPAATAWSSPLVYQGDVDLVVNLSSFSSFQSGWSPELTVFMAPPSYSPTAATTWTDAGSVYQSHTAEVRIKFYPGIAGYTYACISNSSYSSSYNAISGAQMSAGAIRLKRTSGLLSGWIAYGSGEIVCLLAS
jgi:hypothetical protein